MTSPLVSIVLCTYNGHQHLAEQLNSLLNQSYRPLEILIQDDNSSDSTVSLLTDYELRHPNIKTFKNTENIGFNKNFEKAVQLAQGDYIAICDQDDIWFPNKIEMLVNHLGDNWLVFSNSELINEQGDNIDKLLIRPLDIDKFDYRIILMENFVSGHTTLFKRDFIKYIFPFPEAGYYDWWIGFVALYHHKLTYLNKVLTKYRIHDRSVINQQVANANCLKEVNHRSTSVMLTNFCTYLKDRKELNDVNILNNLFRRKSTDSFDYSAFFFLYFHYNHFFPFEKRRNFFSKTRFKFVKQFIKDTIQTSHIQ